jgi:hypothetical protein
MAYASLTVERAASLHTASALFRSSATLIEASPRTSDRLASSAGDSGGRRRKDSESCLQMHCTVADKADLPWLVCASCASSRNLSAQLVGIPGSATTNDTFTVSYRWYQCRIPAAEIPSSPVLKLRCTALANEFTHSAFNNYRQV